MEQINTQIVLRTSPEQVWRAIINPAEFGTWFGVEIAGPFVAGEEAIGQIVPTKVDPEIARFQEPYRGFPWRITVQQIEPMKLFSFRWHPYAIDLNHDYSNEPMTLVSFKLAKADGGTLLIITESGFEKIPASRRAAALQANDGGWAHQTRLIERYLALDEVT